jgi:hypothetical protein
MEFVPLRGEQPPADNVVVVVRGGMKRSRSGDRRPDRTLP